MSLSIDEFRNLTQQGCSYCGSPPQATRIIRRTKTGSYRTPEAHAHSAYTYSGLDRIDSSKGYEAGNVVPCCLRCNRTKNDMSLDDFKAHVQKMYQHLFKE